MEALLELLVRIVERAPIVNNCGAKLEPREGDHSGLAGCGTVTNQTQAPSSKIVGLIGHVLLGWHSYKRGCVVLRPGVNQAGPVLDFQPAPANLR